MRKVSIIIPCYKKDKYLSETLDSVLSQDFADWECVIVNDGSPDNTEQIAKEYCGKDDRFKYVYQDNAGVSAARNSGIKSSSGKYILPLDADDLISADYLKEAVTYMDEHPECKLVYPLVEYFGVENGPFILPEYSFEEEIWNNLIVCSAVYRRCDYEKTSGYNENMVHGLEDWDFWLTLLGEEDIVKRLNIVGIYYRQLSSSRNREAINKMKDIHNQILNNHRQLYEPYFGSLITYREEAARLKIELEKIQSSISYRLGERIAKPYRKIRYKD